MRSININFVIFFTGFLISCQEIENLDLEEVEDKFERFDNFNFQYQNSNVTRIKAIGDRLFYAHKTNPGFISKDMEVIPLCCLSNNQMDFRQSFSNDYVAAVGQDLSFFNIFRVDGSLNFGFLGLNGLLEHLGDRITVSVR